MDTDNRLYFTFPGGARRAARRTFGVRGIVERQSTGDPNEAGRIAARAEEFIREHATVPDVSVGAVAAMAFDSLST